MVHLEPPEKSRKHVAVQDASGHFLMTPVASTVEPRTSSWEVNVNLWELQPSNVGIHRFFLAKGPPLHAKQIQSIPPLQPGLFLMLEGSFDHLDHISAGSGRG